MAGLLDTLFGGGGDQQQQPPQGPAPLSLGDRMAAVYSPDLYKARQQKQQQTATYQAMRQNGASHEQAMALAQNPQFFESGQGAYMPSAPTLEQVPGAFGETSLLQKKTGPGGNIQLSQLGVGGPPGAQPGAQPGTTQNPQQAAQPPAQQTSQGTAIPGSIAATERAIVEGRARGMTAEQLLQAVPAGGRDTVRAVLEGRQDPKELSMRQQDRDLVIRFAHAIDPQFDENRAQAVNKYRKDYADKSIGKVGGQVQSLGTTLEHLESTLDAGADLHNVNLGLQWPSHWVNTGRQATTTQKAKAENFDTKTDLLSGETVRYITGAHGGQGDREQYKSRWSNAATPQELGSTAKAYLEMILGKAREMESARDTTITNPNIAKNFPVLTPQHQAIIQRLQTKINAMRGGGGQAGPAPPTAAGQPQIFVDKNGNKFIKGPDGQPTPYTGQ